VKDDNNILHDSHIGDIFALILSVLLPWSFSNDDDYKYKK